MSVTVSGTVPDTIYENARPGDWVARLVLSGGVLEVALVGADASLFEVVFDRATQALTITPAQAFDAEAYGGPVSFGFGLSVRTAAGWEVQYANPGLSNPGLCIHEVGTARMGDDPKTSVLNKFNQSWDVKNLFVTDGSCFVSQGCQNPTLTMMALTVRACDYIVEEFRRDNV